MSGSGNRFGQLTKVTAQWVRTDNPGQEHLTLEQNDNRITATAVIASADPKNAFGAWYHLFLDDQWQIKAVSVHRTDTHWFIAHSRDPGGWLDADGGALKKFEGCRDIILSATPFTITPIIRRLGLGEGDTAEHDVLFLPIRTLAPARTRQRVTCLKLNSRYRIEDLTAGGEFECDVDDDGLVVGQAGGFKRL